MDSRESTWLFVTDHRAGHLYQVHLTRRRLLRLEAVEEFLTTWVEPEHHQPVPTGYEHVGMGSKEETEARNRTRYCARELGRWIRQHVHDFPVPRRILVCAPDRLYGELRVELLRTILREDLEMRQVELTRLGPARLASHGVVRHWACERCVESPFMA